VPPSSPTAATPSRGAGETADQTYERGLSLLASGHAGEAKKLFVETIRLDPHYAKAHFRSGEIALLNHNLDHAAEQLNRALADGDRLDARERMLAQLGLAIASGQRDEALRIGREIHQQNPADPDLMALRRSFGELFGRQEQPQRRRRFRP
jgi:tetratricopeptide (TPR) repeat protein